MVDRDLRGAFESELQRLGLTLDTLPGGGLASGAGGMEALIKHLKTLQPGASWQDVFPNLPKHWGAGQPHTWITPYRPFGAYDYQELPTGPAVHIQWQTGGANQLSTFIDAARRAGWAIYGAGIKAEPNEHGRSYHAFVVLERGTGEDTLFQFIDWIEALDGFSVATIPRTGDEKYLPT